MNPVGAALESPVSVISAVGGIEGFCESLLRRIHSDLSAQARLAGRIQDEGPLAVGPAAAGRTVVNEGVVLDRLYSELDRLWTRLAHQDMAGC